MKIVSGSIIVVILIATGLFWGCDFEENMPMIK